MLTHSMRLCFVTIASIISKSSDVDDKCEWTFIFAKYFAMYHSLFYYCAISLHCLSWNYFIKCKGLFTPSESEKNRTSNREQRINDKHQRTRMYSSRMRTVRCSGRLGRGGVSLGGVHLNPSPPMDRQTPIKTLPFHNYCCGR